MNCFGLNFTHKYKIQNLTRLLGKVEKETEEDTLWQILRGISLDPALSARTVYCFGEASFECKSTVTLVWIPIEYGKILSTN